MADSPRHLDTLGWFVVALALVGIVVPIALTLWGHR